MFSWLVEDRRPTIPGDDYYPGLAGESRVQATHSTQATITTLASQVNFMHIKLVENREKTKLGDNLYEARV